MSSANFSPTNARGVFYNFFALAPGTSGGAFDYMFTGSDGISLSGTRLHPHH